MPGRAWVVAAVLAAGCRGPRFYDPPAETLPPPAAVGGTEVVVTDHRPAWEKKPFTGKAALYYPGKVRPSPWEQLAAEAGAVAAELPDRPHRVTVAVTSLRLVRTDAAAVDGELRTSTFQLMPGVAWTWNLEKAEDLYPEAVLDHPDGASCAVEATVTVEAAGRPPQVFEVKTIASGPGFTGTAYTGDVFDQPVRTAVIQFGRKFRSAAGLPGG
ncbi:MAG: hypothetical protein C0501_14010 [Isosphaera sp.]|nr:hypothetical protein [Isosphaera sp.]